jgi:serine/threonine protein kinase
MPSIHHDLDTIASKPQKATSLHCQGSNYALEPEISYDQEFLLSAISEADDDINDAKEVQQTLKSKLFAAQERLLRLKLKHGSARDARRLNIYDILFNQIPGYNNHRAIPPMSYDVLETNNQVGAYCLIDCVAKGGFAKVFRAKHQVRGTFHAIKRLDKRQFSSIKDVAQLGREIQVLKSEIHDNVTECSEVINATAHVYIVMGLSFCDLHTYFSRWRSTMGDSVVCEIACGILEGLECLHYIGIAHLDLKPENILVSKDVQPWMLSSKHFKICDFGLCAISAVPKEAIKVDSMRGTAGFISPEMVLLRDGCTVEGRYCDMWSVGVILLELLGGISSKWFNIYHTQREKRDDAAFSAKLHVELAKIQKSTFPQRSGHDLIRRMLQWVPELRISAKLALHHSWVLRVRPSQGRQSESDVPA